MMVASVEMSVSWVHPRHMLKCLYLGYTLGFQSTSTTVIHFALDMTTMLQHLELLMTLNNISRIQEN